MRRALVAAIAALAVALAGSPASAQQTAAPGPGSPGLGDDYYPDYGNGGYDVGHYDIRLRYWPDTDKLAGSTTILARATQDLTSFNLDFALDVAAVSVNGRPAAFAKEGAHELVITPARVLRTNEPFTVVVAYSGIPSMVKVNGFTSWRRTADGAEAVNEPEISWWWYPSNDHPLDKATYDISVLVPEDRQVISNGVQPTPPTQNIPGWKRWSWRLTTPAATYLAFMVIGKYEIRSDWTADGLPITTAYADNLGDNAGAARASVERTEEIVAWEKTLFGPYPFEALGGVVGPLDGQGFSLETQTRPVYGARAFRRGSNASVVVHELAHEWFGDSVSVGAWRNIWLNEGFATYAQWLWSEAQGEGTAQELFDFVYATPADDPFWQVKPGDPGADDPFNGAVYDRGAATLHLIRQAVGDDVFFQILRTWVTERKFSTGTIEQFRALAERLSGKDLSGLFTAWLFTAGRPALPSAAMAAKTAPKKPKSWEQIHDAYEAAH